MEEKKSQSGDEECIGTMENKDYYFEEEELNYYKNNNKIAKICQKPIEKVNWQKGDIIGYGAFGCVFQVLNNETGEVMAVKQVPIIENNDSSKKIEALQLEIDLLSQLSHVNIVQYKGTTRENEFLNIFLEYEAGGSISSLLHKYGPFSEELVKIYARQILDGLEYLHIHNVIHRDIKGANVLVHSNGICRLADFGGAKKICSDEIQLFNSFRGSPFWMAPEVIRQSGAGRQSDIWSFGCTVIEMLTGNPPFNEIPNKMGLLYTIASTDAKPKIPDNISDYLKDFLNHCVDREPGKRWNVFKLIRHPFLSNDELVFSPSSNSNEHLSKKNFDNSHTPNESQIEANKKE